MSDLTQQNREEHQQLINSKVAAADAGERIGTVISSLCKECNIRTTGIELGEQIKELGAKAKNLIESHNVNDVREGLAIINTIETLFNNTVEPEKKTPEEFLDRMLLALPAEPMGESFEQPTDDKKKNEA